MASPIGSFVFFDLETTGLITPTRTPKITEIALIACSTQHLQQTKCGELPRVLHKQTFCLNPRRTIDHEASKFSALYNDMLENESKFDGNIVQLMVLFLQRLQGPTCLVAHNGNQFDYIILKKELADLNAQLPDNTYCVDSLPLFRALDQARDLEQQQQRPAFKSFRLSSVHERLLGHPPKQSHYAECDVEALLKCAIAEGKGFVEHAEKNKIKFRKFSSER
nr:three prime repair exonuclease 2-like [Aedes albopictus]